MRTWLVFAETVTYIIHCIYYLHNKNCIDTIRAKKSPTKETTFTLSVSTISDNGFSVCASNGNGEPDNNIGKCHV